MNEIYGQVHLGDTLGDSPCQDRGYVLAQIGGSGRQGNPQEHDGNGPSRRARTIGFGDLPDGNEANAEYRSVEAQTHGSAID